MIAFFFGFTAGGIFTAVLTAWLWEHCKEDLAAVEELCRNPFPVSPTNPEHPTPNPP